jgi:putative zinc finger/helix-turn-helix YgiT family protein
MKTCSRCRREKVVAITLDDSMDVCGHTFTAQLPAEYCAACGEVVIQGHDMKLFELRVAIELAKAGLRTGESFKFLRKALHLEMHDLAQLLDVSEDVVGYWERADWPVDPRALAVLCSLVLAKFDHRPSSLDCLRVLREPRKLARKVRVHLGDALGHAAKTLQFGSTARTTPALA